MNPIGLDYLTLYGIPQLEFIRIAATVGCTHVGFFSRSIDIPGLPPHPPTFDTDAQLRRSTVACLKDNGVSIGLMDGFSIIKGASVDQYRPTLGMMRDMGVTRINTASLDEWTRTVDEVGRLADLAAECAMTLTLEVIPTFTVDTLPKALGIIGQVRKPNLKLLVDMMHISRTGGVELLLQTSPDLIGYVQLCDGALPMPALEAYMDEAVFDRMVPGEGEFPLVEVLRHVPAHVICSAEVPLRRLQRAGVSDLERARMIATGARRVLAAAESRDHLGGEE